MNCVDANGTTGIVIGEKASWRKGYATEAMKLRTRYAFRELNRHKLMTEVDTENEASRKALERNGYRGVGIRREQTFREGKWHDRWVGEVLRADWEKTQGLTPACDPSHERCSASLGPREGSSEEGTRRFPVDRRGSRGVPLFPSRRSDHVRVERGDACDPEHRDRRRPRRIRIRPGARWRGLRDRRSRSRERRRARRPHVLRWLIALRRSRIAGEGRRVESRFRRRHPGDHRAVAGTILVVGAEAQDTRLPPRR